MNAAKLAVKAEELEERLAKAEATIATMNEGFVKYGQIGRQAAGVLDTFFYNHPSRQIYSTIDDVFWIEPAPPVAD